MRKQRRKTGKVFKALATFALAASMALSAPLSAHADGDINMPLYMEVHDKAYACGPNEGAKYFKMYLSYDRNSKDFPRTVSATTPCDNCLLLCDYQNNRERSGNGLALDTLSIRQLAQGKNTKSVFKADAVNMLFKFDVTRKPAKAYIHVIVQNKDGVKEHVVKSCAKGEVTGTWYYERKGAIVGHGSGTKSAGAASMTFGQKHSSSITVHPKFGDTVVIALSANKTELAKDDPRYTLSSIMSCKKGANDDVMAAGRSGNDIGYSLR